MYKPLVNSTRTMDHYLTKDEIFYGKPTFVCVCVCFMLCYTDETRPKRMILNPKYV